MSKSLKHPNLIVVDLTDNVWVHTIISKENHPALRSGFAGYPANPRWNAYKFRAWKTGRQWREALAQGIMTVRSTDSMLVPVTEQENSSDEDVPSPKRIQLPGWTKQIAYQQIA